jgi:hypothetical protein
MKQTIEKNLDVAVEVYKEFKVTKKNLDKFTEQFGDLENSYNFIYGYFMGELQGIAFSTTRLLLGREMNEPEQNDLVKIVKSKTSAVKNIIGRIKMQDSQGFGQKI